MRLFRTSMLTITIGLATYLWFQFCVVGQSATLSGGWFCGDGVIQETYPSCGDSKVDPGESCDIWSLNGSVCNPVQWGTCTYCSSECQTETVRGPSCGDWVVTTGEECDDGNRANGDSCSSTCKKTFCGDGIVQTGESCDNGTNNGAVCNPGMWSCTYCAIDCSSKTLTGARCGNGSIESGESCDDGNTAGGDGCSATCIAEPQLLDTGAGITPEPIKPVRTIEPLIFGGNFAPPALPSTGPEFVSVSDILGTPVTAQAVASQPKVVQKKKIDTLILPTAAQRQEAAKSEKTDNVDLLDHWKQLNPGLGKTL